MKPIRAVILGLLILLAGCSHNYKSDANRILNEDGIGGANAEQMKPALSAHIQACCRDYKCKPDQVIAGARKIQAVMRTSDPTATLAAAITNIPLGMSSLDMAVDSVVSAFKTL